ncbi:MAG: EpsI family protein, partial [Halioglobus sp.]|nr:EpsI family protein [Halioglobus sp.]
LLLLPAGFGWLLATLVDVLVVQQLALVAMLVIAAWAVLGHRLAGALAFPLGFLFFAVPIGEGLIAPMMDFTAVSTVHLVRLSGIPVFREGLYFELPSGRWSVVEACSGVRYIIASVTVGTLFAYLTYVSWWRRIVFILISAIVPVFANTLRAYIIVMLGHFSDMKIATGADHLVYGWVFFGLVIFVLFWIGAFFREDLPAPGQTSAVPRHRAQSSRGRLFFSTVLVLSIAALAPLWVWQSSSRDALAAAELSVSLPRPAVGWQQPQDLPWTWQPPSMVGGQRQAFYRRGDDTLGLILQFSDGSFDLGEVIGSSRLFAWNDSAWQVIGRDTVTLVSGANRFGADEARLRGPQGEFLVWSWYRLGAEQTANDYLAKVLQAAARLGLREPGVLRVLVIARAESTPAESRARLQRFIDAHASALSGSLVRPQGSAGQ